MDFFRKGNGYARGGEIAEEMGEKGDFGLAGCL